jgi:hypothetical protein
MARPNVTFDFVLIGKVKSTSTAKSSQAFKVLDAQSREHHFSKSKTLKQS